MEFSLKIGNPEKQRTACLIIAVSQQRKLSKSGVMLDKASKGFLSTIIRQGDMDGRSGQSL
jgi:leucyl aminopeptidase